MCYQRRVRTRLRHIWEVLTTGYWFVPTIMSGVAVAMALALLYVDRRTAGAGERLGWLYGGGADGAKTLLSTVAGSVITVAGVAFSITIAALSQASSQFGPRLLRNFMRDTGNQVVLGTFVATFLYCLVILRTIHGPLDAGPAFVPQASVTVAVLMAAGSIAVLIYFIHHVSVSLQAPNVVATAAADLARVVAQLIENPNGSAMPVTSGRQTLHEAFEVNARPISSTSEGYVQAVDYDGLMGMAEKADLTLRLCYRPGDYLIEGSTLLHAAPAERCSDEVERRLNEAFICGRQETPEQDVEYGVRQLVEIAVRALSPGINDPFTAMNCVDALGASLCRVARHGLPGPHRYDRAGRLRLVTPVTTFAGLTDTGFNQIRQYGRESVAVTIRLLEVIAICAEQMTAVDQRQSLLRHAEMIYADSQITIKGQRDRADVRERYETAVRVLGSSSASVPLSEDV
jgi:uncharacterized membrane protein